MDYTSLFGYRADYDVENRIVKQEHIIFQGKKYYVSTVDLGIDYSYKYIDSEPLYYETMIFKKDDWRDMYCNRYSTRETALKEHEQLVEDILNGKYIIDDGYFEPIKQE